MYYACKQLQLEVLSQKVLQDSPALSRKQYLKWVTVVHDSPWLILILTGIPQLIINPLKLYVPRGTLMVLVK